MTPAFHGIKWVFLDWGGTLKDEFSIYEGIAAACERHLSLHGIRIDQQRLYDRLIELEKSEEGIFLPAALMEIGVPVQRLSGVMATLAVELQAQPFYEGVEDVLETLRQSYRLGVISNHRAGLKEILGREGVLSYFEVVVGSADTGLRKPDPAIFRYALELAGCEPHEAVMVGDRLDRDISGANAADMWTVRIRQGIYADQVPQSPVETPNAEIDEIRQLPELRLGEVSPA
ncbi:MAG: HAD family hydrolase [Chloroflexi bacterium]|nr:HAD family hydrolase [Chloroflexota bacterium]